MGKGQTVTGMEIYKCGGKDNEKGNKTLRKINPGRKRLSQKQTGGD